MIFPCRINTKTMALLSLLELVEKLSWLRENEVLGWLFMTQTKKQTNERLSSSYLAEPGNGEARNSYTGPLLLIDNQKNSLFTKAHFWLNL